MEGLKDFHHTDVISVAQNMIEPKIWINYAKCWVVHGLKRSDLWDWAGGQEGWSCQLTLLELALVAPGQPLHIIRIYPTYILSTF